MKFTYYRNYTRQKFGIEIVFHYLPLYLLAIEIL